MGRQNEQAYPPDMVRVRRRIEHWRRTRAKRTRMPEPLWEAAVALAQEHGIHATKRGLGVNYAALKERVVGASDGNDRNRRRKKEQLGPIGFVELSAPLPAASTGTVLEVVKGASERLTLRWAGPVTVDLAELVRDFWRTGR